MPWITFHGTFQRFIAQDGKYLFHKPIIQFVIVLDEVTKQQEPFICKNTVHQRSTLGFLLTSQSG